MAVVGFKIWIKKSVHNEPAKYYVYYLLINASC